ncbi:UNVERIFIED_CONTAM: hypothetical protein FKN15_061720 [Acipenser sinensis]
MARSTRQCLQRFSAETEDFYVFRGPGGPWGRPPQYKVGFCDPALAGSLDRPPTEGGACIGPLRWSPPEGTVRALPPPLPPWRQVRLNQCSMKLAVEWSTQDGVRTAWSPQPVQREACNGVEHPRWRPDHVEPSTGAA